MNSDASTTTAPEFDAIVIGAGVAGLYQVHLLRERGLSVRAFEAGGDVGGTWYWNRYPGARFDSESYTYGYSFSEEVLREWEWSEHFAGQPEVLRYLSFVADKFDLRRDIRFNSRVRSAVFDDAAKCWNVEIEDGTRATARFLVTALGALSAATLPNIPGIDTFKGVSCHTARWPQASIEFAGKRVAVIGTGATGVQVIQEVAKSAAQLTVFQRTPNWCAPLHNGPITPEEQARIKAAYPAMFARCRETFSGFLHDSDRRKALGVSAEEREALYEQLYGEPGFGIWLGNFRDVLVDEAANATLSDFVARKIRQRVMDQAVAEELIPRDHGFGTRRIPMETRYYEVYNQPNVQLVNIRKEPIVRVTPSGIETATGELAFDIIIYATGFDPVTGGFDRVDIRGAGGLRLKEKWADGPATFLGLQTVGFPNMFTIVGPHNPATFCNMPRCIEQNVEWVTDTIAYMRDSGFSRIEATPEAEERWTAHVHESADRMLLTKVNSWFMGINSNVPGKQQRRFLAYAGGAPTHRKACDESAANGYAGFSIS